MDGRVHFTITDFLKSSPIKLDLLLLSNRLIFPHNNNMYCMSVINGINPQDL